MVAKDKIWVSPSSLRSSGNNLIRLGEHIGKLAKEIKRYGDSVSVAWTGADAVAYKSHLDSFLGENEKYAAYVQDFGLALCQSATAYHNARDSVSDKAGK